jgi:ribosome-associated translation inhibitor RaiA
MNTDAIRAHIDRKSAELRGLYPAITHCDSALSQRRENGKLRYSLYLDLRWPQAQVLVSGPPHDDAGAAIDAAFHEARSRIEEATWASR